MAPLMKAAVAGLVAVASAHWREEGVEHGHHDHEHHDHGHGPWGHHDHEHHHHGEHEPHDGEHERHHWGHHHGEGGDEGAGRWGHGGGKWGQGGGKGGVCPYLSKAVPMGEGYIKVVQSILDKKSSGDCAGFAGMFAEQGNFTVMCSKRNVTKELHGAAEMEMMCNEHQHRHWGGDHQGGKAIHLKSLFPAFHTGDALFEVEVEHGDFKKTGLWQGHYCEKQKKVMSAKIIKGVAEDVPAALRAAGESFLRKVQEAGDCSALSDVLESGVVVETFGEAALLTFGSAGNPEPKADLASYQKVCEAKAWKQKKVQKSVKLTVGSTYYDAAQRELTFIAKKEVQTIFRAEPMSRPVAVVLRFSPAGKVEHARFYETEVTHLEAKWGSTYGKGLNAPAEEERGFIAKSPVLGKLAQLGRYIAMKVGVVPKDDAEGQQWGKKEWAGKKEEWKGKWESKIEDRLAKMPEDVKKQKCERFGQKEIAEWAKEKPWWKAMEKMCAELKKGPAPVASAPSILGGSVVVLTEQPESANARGLSLAFSSVTVLGLSLARL